MPRGFEVREVDRRLHRRPLIEEALLERGHRGPEIVVEALNISSSSLSVRSPFLAQATLRFCIDDSFTTA